MSKNAPTLWHPRYWPSWLFVGFLKAIAPLPIPLLLWFGRALGWFAFHFVPIRRAVTEKNLEICFPELSAKERRKLALRSYESLGMGVFEALLTYHSDAKRMAGFYTINGIENLERARMDGRGVILLSAHMHTLEISCRIGLLHFEFCAFFRNPNNPVFAKFIYAGREKLAKQLFAMDDLKGAVRALREGSVLWYAPDQAKVFKETVVAPFFGTPAVTNAATGKIAKLGRAAIVPWSAVRERRDGRWHYNVTIHPAIEALPEDSMAEAIALNQLIEKIVRAAPEQYLWQHKRFKYRGEGFSDPYAGMR